MYVRLSVSLDGRETSVEGPKRSSCASPVLVVNSSSTHTDAQEGSRGSGDISRKMKGKEEVVADAEERFLDAVEHVYNNKDTTLYFSYQEDLDAIPAAIKALRTTLEVLHVDNSYTLTTLPTEIGDLGRLRWLNVSYCRLATLPPELGRLSHLERLYLSNNVLPSLPMEVWQLKNLEELRLDNNKLRVLPGGILFLPKLKTLTLENNPLLMQEDVLGAEPATLVPPIRSVDCSNCCVRLRNYQMLITFHNVAELSSVPFMHTLCSETCKKHLEVRLEEYNASYKTPKGL